MYPEKQKKKPIPKKIMSYITLSALLLSLIVNPISASAGTVKTTITLRYGSNTNMYEFELPDDYYTEPVIKIGDYEAYYQNKSVVRPCVYTSYTSPEYEGAEVSEYAKKHLSYMHKDIKWSDPNLLKVEPRDNYSLTITERGASTGTWIMRENIKYISIPIFNSYASAKTYADTGKITDKTSVTLPDGYYVDENGEMKEIPYKFDVDMGYPLNFEYTEEYGTQINISGGKDLIHLVKWTNKNDYLGYTVQLQYRGEYKVKKGILSSWETINVPYTDIDEIDMIVKEWKCPYSKFDKSSGIIYDKICEISGYKPYSIVNSTSKQQFRARYVRYSGYTNGSGVTEGGNTHSGGGGSFGNEGEKIYYGKWVYGNMDGDGSDPYSYVGDDNGNPEWTEEYGDGTSYKNGTPSVGNSIGETISNVFESMFSPITSIFTNAGKFLTNLFSNATSLTTEVGKVPSMMASLLSFLPGEVWTIISLGIGVVVVLRIFGR